MSKVAQRIKDIKEQHIGATGIRVLLVEGPDDVDAFRIFLDKRFKEWETLWCLEPAGNKKQVIEFLRLEANWLGVVDRDEWTPNELLKHRAELPNLQVLPRFCMESYLVDPVELWAALPKVQQDKISKGFDELQAEIEKAIGDWIRQAALWHEIRPLWRTLRELEFPDIASSKPPVPNDSALQELLPKWQAVLDPLNIVSKVSLLEKTLVSMQRADFYASRLYAKNFYPIVVCRVLNQLLGPMNEKERRNAIFRTRDVPNDLDPLWQAMGLIP